MKRRLFAGILSAALVLGLMSACKSKTPVEPAESETSKSSSAVGTSEPVYGGTLKVTVNSDATILDALVATSPDDQVPATHIYETALFPDAGGNIWPGVCDYTYVDNVLTLTMRNDVTFHNGEVCTINDVYASAQRWLLLSSAAKKQVANKLQSMEVLDNSLVLTFKEVAPLALQAITGYDGGLYIFPASICEKYGENPISDEADLIGTGPYMFVEHRADQYVLVKRYDGYVPVQNKGATGFAAPKMAYCDEIYFYPVSDKTTRITGVQTGEYDVGVGIPANLIEEMRADPNLTVTTSDLGTMACLIFNNQKGPCSDVNLRRAILSCLDMDELMLAAQGDPNLYRLNPCYMMASSRWNVEDSLGKYNHPDLDAAKAYLAQSSYNGETLVYITTTAYDYYYNTAILVAQMAEQIGIKMDVQVYDNATMQEYRANPDKFDIFSGGLTAKTDPSQIAFMDETWPGFWANPEKDALLSEMSSTDDFNSRYSSWEALQRLIYTEVPNINFGERINPIVCRKNVHNLFETPQKYYWNTWKEA